MNDRKQVTQGKDIPGDLPIHKDFHLQNGEVGSFT